MAHTFTGFFTLMTQGQASDLIAGLVQHGLEVGPLGRDPRAFYDGNLSCLCTLRLSVERQFQQDQNPSLWVLEQVREVLDAHQHRHYSLVVTGSAGSAWVESNIPRPNRSKADKKDSPAPEPLKSLEDVLDPENK